MSKEHVTSLAEVAGSVAIVVGAAMLSAAAGWLVGGALGLLFAYKVERSA
jgi:hypothetical protein